MKDLIDIELENRKSKSGFFDKLKTYTKLKANDYIARKKEERIVYKQALREEKLKFLKKKAKAKYSDSKNKKEPLIKKLFR